MKRTSGQSTPSAEDDVGEQRFAQIEIDSVDRVDNHAMHSRAFVAYDLRVEQDFCGTKTFMVQLDSASAHCSCVVQYSHPNGVAIGQPVVF